MSRFLSILKGFFGGGCGAPEAPIDLPSSAWIPATRPPTHAKDVFVCRAGQVSIGWYEGPTWSMRVGFRFSKPDYWMEIPEPPAPIAGGAS